MTEFVLTVLSLLPFYLIGAIPTGALIAKAHGVDIREHGSGNVGATNLARVIGKRAGLYTLGIDIAKGVLPGAIGAILGFPPTVLPYCGVAAVLGHCYSLPRISGTHPYRTGGKGVATALGAVLSESIGVAGIGIAAFSFMFLWKRIVSLSSLVSAAILPIAALLLSAPEPRTVAFTIITTIIFLRHRENLERLARGEEQPLRIGDTAREKAKDT